MNNTKRYDKILNKFQLLNIHSNNKITALELKYDENMLINTNCDHNKPSLNTESGMTYNAFTDVPSLDVQPVMPVVLFY